MNIDNFSLLYRSLPLLAKGALLSLQIVLIAALFSFFLGSCMGIITCQHLRSRTIASCIEAIAFVLRAIPYYVQLLIAYFVLPDLLGIEVEAFSAAIISLSLCSSGYVAQVIRCGINSIAKSQWESAYTLGYSTTQTLYYIIFPQVFRNVLPALTNEFDALLKSTAILASIGILELTRMGMNIISREMEPLTIYLAVAFLYVVISGAINLISKYIERRISQC